MKESICARGPPDGEVKNQKSKVKNQKAKLKTVPNMLNNKMIILSLLIIMTDHSFLMFAIELLLFIYLVKEYLKLKTQKNV